MLLFRFHFFMIVSQNIFIQACLAIMLLLVSILKFPCTLFIYMIMNNLCRYK